EFSSGAKVRKFIWTPTDVLPAATSQPFRLPVIFLAVRSQVSIRAAGSCPAPGPLSSEILRSTPQLTLSIFTLNLMHYIQFEIFQFSPTSCRNDTGRWRMRLRA